MSKVTRKADGSYTVHGDKGIQTNLPSDKVRTGPSTVPAAPGRSSAADVSTPSRLESLISSFSGRQAPAVDPAVPADSEGFARVRAEHLTVRPTPVFGDESAAEAEAYRAVLLADDLHNKSVSRFPGGPGQQSAKHEAERVMEFADAVISGKYRTGDVESTEYFQNPEYVDEYALMKTAVHLRMGLESGAVSTDDLREAGYSDRAVMIADAVTRRAGEAATDYVFRAESADPIASVIVQAEAAARAADAAAQKATKKRGK